MSDPAAFVAAQTRIAAHGLVPELRLHLADALTPIWQATEAWLAREGIEPPYWAFAWPGSVAIARRVLDAPAGWAGLRVLDFAAGCGVAAIACARAGAAVTAAEIDPVACAAIRLNAALNEVAVEVIAGDIVGTAGRWDRVLAGDVCYAAPMAARVLPWLRALAAAGAEVWLADPGRASAPRDGVAVLAEVAVPTTRELEDRTERVVRILRLLPG